MNLRGGRLNREADLLFGLIALQMNFVTREQLLECAAVWMGDGDATLSRLLAERGHLRDFQQAAVQALVDARLRTHEGDPSPSLQGIHADTSVVQTLLECNPPPTLRETLRTLHPVKERETVVVARPREDRYRLGEELGRGGLGRVVSAQDRDLKREVAIKLVLDGLSAELVERFVREAELTARLEHPNIVPVHDFGTMTMDSGRKQVFLCMKRIRGRDLGKLLRAIESGDRELGRTWTRARLLRIFQDICIGIAFAHDRGVIHRDLKPANVMVGDYGETLIVDWGLARVMAGQPEPVSGTDAIHAPGGDTQDGRVIGTPAYMPPEQAEGRISEMDARSDVYSLGAILYEILTFRAPFEGANALEILRKVEAGRITPPSSRVADRVPPAPAAPGVPPSAPSAVIGVATVPPELDAICLKALARDQRDRYASAMELHDEIQLFLEGVKEHEREHRLSEEALTGGREAIARLARLRDEARTVQEEARKKEREIRPLDDKEPLWALQDRARAIQRELAETFAEADAALTLALSHERDHREARSLKADLHWARFVEAEEAEDERAMALHRKVVEQHHDGRHAARLEGSGKLTVRAWSFPCRCLEDGRMVLPEELAHLGFHPYSGRSLDRRKGAEGVRAFEPEEGRLSHLKVHVPGCKLAPAPGADVWLFRYEESGRRLVPVTPERPAAAGAPPCPAVFAEDSAFRPRGAGAWLGRTPIEGVTLSMGSWLLVVAHPGFATLRVPVHVARGVAVVQDVTLFRASEIPAGFEVVARGRFTAQGDPGNPHSGAPRAVDLAEFFIARHPVTCGEYSEFLNDLASTDQLGAIRRAPREAAESGPFWAGFPWSVPTRSWLAGAPVRLRAEARRLPGTAADWEDRWPVLGVSWEDALAFAARRRSAEQRLFTLPHDLEWEKAARGPDRRPFPWGRLHDPRWSNGQLSFADGPRPAAVEEFASDESPWGVRGLAGNAAAPCLNDPGGATARGRVFRGGSWSGSPFQARSTDRRALSPTGVGPQNGIRLVCLPRL